MEKTQFEKLIKTLEAGVVGYFAIAIFANSGQKAGFPDEKLVQQAQGFLAQIKKLSGS
jgi:hypothetical protein